MRKSLLVVSMPLALPRSFNALDDDSVAWTGFRSCHLPQNTDLILRLQTERTNEKTATRAVFKGLNKVTSLTPALVTTVRAASFPT